MKDNLRRNQPDWPQPKVSEDDFARERALAREKFMWDQQSLLEDAREEGREEVHKEVRRLYVPNMYSFGMDFQTIAKITKLSVEEIRKIVDGETKEK